MKEITVAYLRKRAARYRELLSRTADAAVAARYREIGQLLDQEADSLERYLSKADAADLASDGGRDRKTALVDG